MAILAILTARYALGFTGDIFVPLDIDSIKIPIDQQPSATMTNYAPAGFSVTKAGSGILDSTDVNDFLAKENSYGNTLKSAEIGESLYRSYISSSFEIPGVKRVIAIDDPKVDKKGNWGYHIFIVSDSDYDKYKISEHREMYSLLQSLREKYPDGYHRVQWKDSKYIHEMKIYPDGHVTDCNCPPDWYLKL